MTEAERNYDVHDRELLAIMKTFESWRHYLAGSPHKIDVWSDHRNLEYFRQARKLNRRQARWSAELQDYDFQIIHKPGKLQAKSDALSRRRDHDNGANNNEEKVLLPNTLFVRRVSTTDDLRDRIRNSTEYDPQLATSLEALKSGNSTLAKDLDHWSEDDGLLYYKNRLYVPNDIQLRREIAQLHHDHPAAGHRGQAATVISACRDYWWPNITGFLRNYVKGCSTCQSTKIQTRRPPVPMMPIPAEHTLPFQTVTMDFIVDLPESDGYNAIAVFADHDSSKAAIMVPCLTTITAEQTAELYFNHVFRHFGLPKTAISDRGPQYNSAFLHELYRKLQIDQRFSTAYHPQTDGGTERINQELEQYLRAFCNYRQNNWAKLLLFAEFAHNSAQHATTGQTPFYLLMGYHPRWFPNINQQTNVPAVKSRLEELQRVRKDAEHAHQIAADIMRNNHPGRQPMYKEGDRVWLEGKNLTTTHPAAKLRPQRMGPFPIEKVMGPITFRLTLPPSWRIHPVFHAGLLSPYNETTEHGPNATNPPPELINDEEQWEVDEILDSEWKAPQGKRTPILHYLVHYTGYDNADNEWRPHHEFDLDDQVVLDFYAQNPHAPSLTHKPSRKQRTRSRRR